MAIVTAEDEADRMRLYDQGLDDTTIGKKLYLSRWAVFKWRKRNGLPSVTERLHSRFEELYKLNRSDHAIARETGVSSTCVRMWRIRNKLPRRYEPGMKVAK